MFSFFYCLNFAINYLRMCDYKLKMQYVLNSRSFDNRQTVRVTRRYFIPSSLFEFLSLTFPLNFQLITFPCMNEYFCTSPAHAPITFLSVRGRVLSQTLTIRRLCCHFSHSYIKTFSECWSTLIVMIYDIFASQTEHIFAIYARTKEHFVF